MFIFFVLPESHYLLCTVHWYNIELLCCGIEHRVSGVDVSRDANITRGFVETRGWGPNWLPRQRVSEKLCWCSWVDEIFTTDYILTWWSTVLSAVQLVECIDLYSVPELLISMALRMARVNKGSHSFACHPHVYLQMEWTILHLLPSHRASPHFGRYLFPIPQRVGGWVAQVALYIPRFDLTTIECQSDALTTRVLSHLLVWRYVTE